MHSDHLQQSLSVQSCEETSDQHKLLHQTTNGKLNWVFHALCWLANEEQASFQRLHNFNATVSFQFNISFWKSAEDFVKPLLIWVTAAALCQFLSIFHMESLTHRSLDQFLTPFYEKACAVIKIVVYMLHWLPLFCSMTPAKETLLLTYCVPPTLPQWHKESKYHCSSSGLQSDVSMLLWRIQIKMSTYFALCCQF